MTALTIPAERTTLTLDEFLALPEHDENGNFFELSEGKLLKVSPTGYPHARRMAVIAGVLFQVLDRTKYDIVGGEASILMAGDPKATVRGMDLAVVLKEGYPSGHAPHRARTCRRSAVSQQRNGRHGAEAEAVSRFWGSGSLVCL